MDQRLEMKDKNAFSTVLYWTYKINPAIERSKQL